MGQGSEIFVLDMGDPARIIDLSRDIIAMSGFKPFEDKDIVFTGLRPGEKLLSKALVRLSTLSRTGNESGLREFLRGFLPESQPGK